MTNPQAQSEPHLIKKWKKEVNILLQHATSYNKYIYVFILFGAGAMRGREEHLL